MSVCRFIKVLFLIFITFQCNCQIKEFDIIVHQFQRRACNQIDNERTEEEYLKFLNSTNSLLASLAIPIKVKFEKIILHSGTCPEYAIDREFVISSLIPREDISESKIHVFVSLFEFDVHHDFIEDFGSTNGTHSILIPYTERLFVKTFAHEVIHCGYDEHIVNDLKEDKRIYENAYLTQESNYCSNIMSVGVGPFNFLSTEAVRLRANDENHSYNDINVFVHSLPCVPLKTIPVCFITLIEKSYQCCNHIKLLKEKQCIGVPPQEEDYVSGAMSNPEEIYRIVDVIYDADYQDYRDLELPKLFDLEAIYFFGRSKINQSYTAYREIQYYDSILDMYRLEDLKYNLMVKNPEILKLVLDDPFKYTDQEILDMIYDTDETIILEIIENRTNHVVMDYEYDDKIQLSLSTITDYTSFSTYQKFYLLVLNDLRTNSVLRKFFKYKYNININKA